MAMATAIAAPHLSTDCRSISQISLFGCELNSILGIHIGVGEAVVGIRRAAAGSQWSTAPRQAITREKPREKFVLCCLRSL
jgi:hypothetical protein